MATYFLIVGKVEFFNKLVAIFGNKYDSFSPNNMGRKKLSESVFGYFKTKKVPTATKLKGGGG